MDMVLATILDACALLFSYQIRAGAGWTDYVTVAELVRTSLHYYTVRLPVKDNPSGYSNKTWFHQDDGALGADKMYLSLLEAVKSHLKVRVYVNGNRNFHGHSEISSVSIVP